MKFYKDNYDFIPITHTIECYIEKRVNRINKEVAKNIKVLYIEDNKSIEEISIITGKSVERIKRFLTENKLVSE